MVNIGDLVYAVNGLQAPAVGVVIDLSKSAFGLTDAVVWWADDGKCSRMQMQYAMSLKKNVDKYKNIVRRKKPAEVA